MLYAIAKLFCVCQEQAVNIQYDIHIQCNKKVSWEVIKIASLFKLHVNNTCSAVHNRINKINFLREEEFFSSKFTVGENFDLLFGFENMASLFCFFFF